MRGFEFCYERNEQNTDYVLNEQGERIKLREDAQLPLMATSKAGAYDFFAAIDVTIPPTHDGLLLLKPVLVPTGIKAKMDNDNEIFVIANRSGNPGKRDLVLANGIGIIDADYYDIEGEICFSFYNFGSDPVHIKAGERIGQGFYVAIGRAEYGYEAAEEFRSGGFGSTGTN